jgi:predicted ArsR family transcriptional regulator
LLLVDRLPVFKALGDNTRYAIYLELARSAVPLSTAEVAESLDLHPNTVRPHLERMREVGLLEVEADSQGTVGRPQHRWSLVADAPSLGLEPSAFRLLARLLASVAAVSGVDQELVAQAGRVEGRAAGSARAAAGTQSCLEALVDELADLGFDPAVGDDGEVTSVGFTRCPFRELAEAFPELVCHLHRGIVEGLVEGVPNSEVAVSAFATLADRDPCRVELISR